jgi:hypothetical protein
LWTGINELPRVTLMKLHCEGSEWPILFASGLLARVERIVVQLHSIKRKEEEANCELIPELQANIKRFTFDALANRLASAGFIQVAKPLLDHSTLSVASAESPITEIGLAYFRTTRHNSERWDW